MEQFLVDQLTQKAKVNKHMQLNLLFDKSRSFRDSQEGNSYLLLRKIINEVFE